MSLRKIEQAKASASLTQYVEEMGGEPLVITKRGRPVAVLVPVRGMDYETLSLSTNPDFLAILERSRASGEKEGWIAEEEIRKEFGLAETTPETEKKGQKKVAS